MQRAAPDDESCDRVAPVQGRFAPHQTGVFIQRLFFGLTLAVFVTSAAIAGGPADIPVVTITLKDHRFSPDRVTIPAGKKIKFEVTNRDATADDFDSDDLHVDRDLKPHEHASFVVGPLKPGHYAFKGELHAETAHGVVIVEASTAP